MSPAEPNHTVDADGARPAAPAGSVAAKVVVVAGPDTGLEAPLGDVLEIGTHAAAGLRLQDASVSRRHLLVKRIAGRFVVKDLGSRNGTHLGSVRLVEADVPLGAVLRLGNTSVAIQPRWYVRELPPSQSRSFGELYGESVAMRELFAILERVAPTAVTVLVEGESGTGKELVARSIHRQSARASGPLVVFDCSAVPAELAESELFGHKKGAFSGAIADRLGAFVQAHQGTIFLDELGEMPPDLQAKLLRVLEVGEVRAVGDDVARKVDVRVVAATNRELHAEVQHGRFRADLLYRLEVVRLRMPSLRHRPEDVPGLVERLLAGKLPPGDAIEGENLAKLSAYAWPGNVRELRNTLMRAVALAQTAERPLVPFAELIFNLGPASATPTAIGMDLPGLGSRMPYKVAKAQLLSSFDRAYLASVLDRHDGNVTKAAAAAGLSRKHMYELIRRVEEAVDEGRVDDA